MKQLLKNAKIYDGSGEDPFIGDILLDGDRILEVGPSVNCTDAEVTDLKGLSVSSGFFDGHSHNDWFCIKKEPLKYFEPFIRQGFTSFIAGNCGMSAFGFEDTADIKTMGGGLFGYKGDATGVYPSAKEFFDAVDQKMPCNLASLVGHCTTRASVAGFENRPLTEDENRRMLHLVEQALQEGACGASLGLMYQPGVYADAKELRGVAELCEKYDLPLTVHPRAESKVSLAYPLGGRAHILRAMDELEEVCKGLKVKLQYSHFIMVGRTSFKYKDEVLKILNRMRDNGVDARFDIYNETLGTSVITVVLPGWFLSMSPEEKKKPLTLLKLRILCAVTIKLLGFGWPDIQIADLGEGHEMYEGKTVKQIADEMGKDCLSAYIDLCEMSDYKGRVNMGPYSTPEIIHEFEKNELCNFMTDAWVEERGVQNPAVYDCHPKFLRDSLLGLGAPMPETVRKMTGAVADRFSIPERGYIRPGFYADLTVFDEEKLKNGTPDQGKAFGIEKVYINGIQVLDGDRLDTEALKTSGQAIRTSGKKD